MLDALFNGQAIWFSVPALIGTLFLLFRLFALMAGTGHDLHAGDHLDAAHGGTGDHPDHPTGMQLISVTGGFGFLAGFGWGGLAALKGTQWDMVWVILTATIAGFGILLMQAFLFKNLLRLQASGNIALSSAMGAEGVVYIEVPGSRKGKGQVTVVVQDRRRQIAAITDGDTLPSQTRVNVVAVNTDNTVTVRRAP